MSFCAYNTGIGWRNIIEKMHMTVIAKNAREEKLRARKAEAENKRMAELYRQVVLKEPKPELATGLQI